MRTDNVTLINGSATAPIVSNGIDTSQQVNVGLHIVATGAPVGSIIIEVSNDNVPVALGNASANVVNWATYGSATAVSGALNSFISIPDICAKWLRVRYTFTSGTGNILVNYMGRGA